MPWQIHVIPPPRGQPYLNISEPRRFPDGGNGKRAGYDKVEEVDSTWLYYGLYLNPSYSQQLRLTQQKR